MYVKCNITLDWRTMETRDDGADTEVSDKTQT